MKSFATLEGIEGKGDRLGETNVCAFKGPFLDGAVLLQYDNFLGGPLSVHVQNNSQ